MRDDDTGWAAEDPDYVAARVRGVVQSMAARWRGCPVADIEVELHRRLAPLSSEWPAETTEQLARHIQDPRWHWKHPWQALELGSRVRRRAAEGPG